MLLKKMKFFIVIIAAAILFPVVSQAQLLNTVVALTGNVFDAVSKEPVTAILIVKDENGERVAATRSNSFDNGYYYLTPLKPGRKYTIIIRLKNYFAEQFEIYIANSDKYEEISRDFLVKPSAVGSKLPLPVPPFELNKSKLRYGAEEFLVDIKNTIVNNPKAKFELHCYPDTKGSAKENLALTKERCDALMSYLSTAKIDPSRVVVKPHSETDPSNPPPTKKKAKGKRYIGPTYLVVTES